jgi:hypothetical protein
VSHGDTSTMTHTEMADGSAESRRTSPKALCFVVAWSGDEPARVGEVMFVPQGRPGPEVVFGRGSTDGPTFVKQRPGHSEKTGPIMSPRISRAQLAIQSHGDHLVVENIGRRTLYHNGDAAPKCKVRIGDVLELGGQLMLLCSERPVRMRPPPEGVEIGYHPFGRADRFGMVGETPAVWSLRERVSFIAGRSTHVMVMGESGTGKELVAQGIHALSPRGRQAIVSRNAATLPEGLIDAELFGNVRGYPNPGMRDRPGLIGEADGSTLFLDEVGELPMELQSHLLRVLDNGEYQRLGEARVRFADFRLIVATNRNEDALKHDVLARLRVRLHTPSLNERVEDIPLLVRHLLQRVASADDAIAIRYFPDADPTADPRIEPALLRGLIQHFYTTHVRELEGLLWHAMTNSLGDVISLTPGLGLKRRAGEAATQHNEVNEEMIRASLSKHRGVQARVWRELGLKNRHVLARLVKKFDIDPLLYENDDPTEVG